MSYKINSLTDYRPSPFFYRSDSSDGSSSGEEIGIKETANKVGSVTKKFMSFYPWRDDPKNLTDFEVMHRVQQLEAHPDYFFKDIVSIYPIAARERLNFLDSAFKTYYYNK